MKKPLLTILLACLLGVVHAAGLQAAAPLLAGAAAVDITPEPDVPLSGPIGGSGLATKIHDPLHVRALALQSGETCFVFAVADLTVIGSGLHGRIRARVHEETGLPENHLLVSATHTHRSPRATPLDLGSAHERYMDRVVDRTVEAVILALDRLESARLGWGAVDAPANCRNRRWLMEPGKAGLNPFGENTDRAKMYGGPGKPGIRPLGPVDPELFVLSAQRPDGSQLALLANFSIHYGAGGAGVSADYFGHFSRETARLLGATEEKPVVVMMSNGTSGDVAPGGNPPELGRSLAEAAAKVVASIAHRDALPLAVREADLSVAVRKPDAERLAWARAVLAGEWDEPAHKWKKKYARSALWLNEYPVRVPVRLQVIRLGDLAIAASPCEVYAETGLAIKEESPFADTFNISLANGYNGYLPTPAQHKLGGYTTWPAISSPLAVDAEPKIRAELLRLLKDSAE